ncbi:nucleotidyltransferase family protein [Oryzifoliimicrobium ureilyticus]|uniref:nucleotidyltransferase family protein n=1 Tax=Oryzifoliimicrobium ureilyticus TaxID=3113724 RepID=UPI0030766BAF
MLETAEDLQAILAQSPLLEPVLAAWDRLALPDVWLAAGAVAQTVWNHGFGFSPTHGINDIDIVYFDADDLSEAAEADHAQRIRSLFSALGTWIDVKNEARVHLWYEEKFGAPIRPYRSVADAITTFPTTATAIGVRPEAGGLALEAPFGLTDLAALTVRANKVQITRDIYEAKIDRWQRLWPGLRIIDWED